MNNGNITITGGQVTIVVNESNNQEVIDFNSLFSKDTIRKTVRESKDKRQLLDQFMELSAKERTANGLYNNSRIDLLHEFDKEIESILHDGNKKSRAEERKLYELSKDISREINKLSNKANGGYKSNLTRKVRQQETEIQRLTEENKLLRKENQQLKNQNDIAEFKDLSSFHMVPRHSFTANQMIEARNNRIVNSYQYRTWLDRLNLSDFLPPVLEDVDFTGKLKLTIGFVSIESMDLDNQIKAIQDELSHYYSFNDNQIAALNAVRLDVVDSYDEGRMYIKITNINIGDDDEER